MTDRVGDLGRRRVTVVAVLAATTAVMLCAAIVIGRAGETSTDRTHVTTWFVRSAQTGKVLYERPMQIGEAFELRHTHSVTERLVRETFSVTDATTIALEELWFDRHGANLPTGPETIGDITTTFLTDNGAYRVLHHSRPLGTVPLLIGSAAVNHVVVFSDGSSLKLLDIGRAGMSVEVGVARHAG